ncbi:MAG: hypothetical protein ACI8W8_002231 [Rhodothermales bacterium]
MAQLVFTVFLGGLAAFGQFPEWKHSGAVFINTTPDGANLPADVVVEDFPILLRLSSAFFDFSEARPDGADLRFSAASKPLAYEIEHWDAAQGSASIWVRTPQIAGNSRQELRMHWGNPDAGTLSEGKTVFSGDNGYVTVWHMAALVDSVGRVTASDTGTSAVPGLIGGARHLPGGKGINCGEANSGFPSGAAPHSTAAWIRAEALNATIVAWGNEKAQGKVVLKLASPAHVRTDCYFSNGNVRGTEPIPLGEWVHVVHTYESGNARIYVNGTLDSRNSAKNPALNIAESSRMYIGGWYNRYRFVGDIDELSISKVARSAAWVKLQYENQKPQQTLVGHLVQSGREFSASVDRLSIAEGTQARVHAKAGGAQKVYWLLNQRVLATDQFSVAIDAGRVKGNTARSLQFRAIYANEVKRIDIPITVTEAIPEPVFILEAPATWDGRSTIELRPRIANSAALAAAGASDLQYSWKVSGLATLSRVEADHLVLERAQSSGRLTVSLALSNGGEATHGETSISVEEPANDLWTPRVPGPDEKPLDGQFYARGPQNVGTLHCNGNPDAPADSLVLRLYADETCVDTRTQAPKPDQPYAFAIPLKPGLIGYRIELHAVSGGKETLLHKADDLVCGDAYLIEGQSNALATDTRDKAARETNPWIRSYGRPRHADKHGPNLWCKPVWKAEREHLAELGWWGMELAKSLLERHKMPICIINAAAGGTRIDQHQRDQADPTNLDSIYGRMLWRVREAKLTHGIRAVLWHQGENDQGAAGPDGGYGWESYHDYFVHMSADWKRDFPNLERYYVFQIWPNACSMGSGNGDMLREKQRSLGNLYSRMDVMSTLGIQPGGGCHYPLEGWTQIATLIQPAIERDFYGVAPTKSITAPNLQRARFVDAAKSAIRLEFDQPVVWDDQLREQFYLDGQGASVRQGVVDGNTLTLTLESPTNAGTIDYLHETRWKPENLLRGSNGIAALSFCAVAIEGE